MRLIDHIAFDLTGRANLSTMSPQALAWWLTDLHGGNSREAARQLGVAESTFRGWRHGTPPKKAASVETLREAARQTGAEIADEDKVGDLLNSGGRAGDLELTIRGVFTHSSDTRERTIHPGRHLSSSAIRDVMRLWVQGDDDQAEELLLHHLDHDYHPLAYDQVYWARFLEPGEQVR